MKYHVQSVIVKKVSRKVQSNCDATLSLDTLVIMHGAVISLDNNGDFVKIDNSD